MILLKHELKEMVKSLLIWSISVGLICAGCILLYKNLESQLSKTAQLYANMGDMTKALGMDKISLVNFSIVCPFLAGPFWAGSSCQSCWFWSFSMF